MYYYQWAILLALFLLFLNKESRISSIILFFAYLIYLILIKDLDAIYYYSAASLRELIVGALLQRVNKKAAICSYLLVIVNLFGFWLWFAYFDPLIYDIICGAILIIQLITIIPKGPFDGAVGRGGGKYSLDHADGFDCREAYAKMHKTSNKKA